MAAKESAARASGCKRTLRAVQISLVAFFALAAASVVVIYAIVPAIYTETLDGNTRTSNTHPPEATALLIAVVLLVFVLSVGVLRRWRWVFWLILIAFILSVLQVPGGVLELTGIVPVSFPAWYIIFRMLVGAIQFIIGLAMIRLYRRCGVWANAASL